MAEQAEIAEPSIALRQQYIDYCQEFKEANEPFVHRDLPEAISDFTGLLRKWSDMANKTDLPQEHYWLVDNRRIVGTARLRCRLNDALMHEGGHIGYEVRRSDRGKGYATLILKRMLEKARDLGLKRVLVTCDKDNAASARTIQKNGGTLENEVVSNRSGKMVQRYWIKL